MGDEQTLIEVTEYGLVTRLTTDTRRWPIIYQRVG